MIWFEEIVIIQILSSNKNLRKHNAVLYSTLYFILTSLDKKKPQLKFKKKLPGYILCSKNLSSYKFEQLLFEIN